MVARSVLLVPRHDDVAVGVHGDLRAGSANVVGFDRRGGAPTAAGGKAAGPDVVFRTVGLEPHRDSVAVGVHGDLWGFGIASGRDRDQRGGAPTAAAGGVAVGPDVVERTVELVPHRDGVAVGVHGDLWATGTTSVVGFDQSRSAPM